MIKKLFTICLLIFFIVGCSPKVETPKIQQDTPLTSNTDFSNDDSLTIINLQDKDTFNLSADKITKTIEGNQLEMYGYNGEIPGPILKVEQNSTITINFQNNIDYETTVHWHGLRHDNKFDGVPRTTQKEVLPGESFTYQVYFPDAGVFWYHPHVREDLQQEMGLAANMYAFPKSHKFNEVNNEEFLILDDILIVGGEMYPFDEEYANNAIMGRFGNVNLINGQDDYTYYAKKGEVIRFFVTNVANVRPYNLTFGGAKIKLVGSDLGKYEKEEFVDSIIISPAERYIVEVLFDEEKTYPIKNENPLMTHYLGFVKVKGTTNNDLSSQFNTLNENKEVISDINTFKDHFDKEVDYEIELTMDMPMEMMMQMGHGSNDHSTSKDSDHKNDNDPHSMMANMPCHRMPDGSWMGDCEKKEENPMDSMPCHMMGDGTMMGDCQEQDDIEWEDLMGEFNRESTTKDVTWILKDKVSKKENMDFMMKAKVGDVLKIRLHNTKDSMHPMQHPIHLHGQRFLVIEQDGIKNENLVWKDTVLVPRGSTTDILVDVTNPGKWMMHCHIAEHLTAGMMNMLIVEE